MLVYDKIFENLWLRKAYHLIGGLLLVFGLVELGPWFFAVGIVYLIVFWLVGKRISFAMLGILVVLATTGSVFITVGATIVFWIGDGFAALIGAQFGRTRWTWNRNKSIAGSFAFFASSTVALLIFFASVFQGITPAVYPVALVTAFVATTAEMVPLSLFKDRKADDNFVILLVSGITLRVVTHLSGLALPAGWM